MRFLLSFCLLGLLLTFPAHAANLDTVKSLAAKIDGMQVHDAPIPVPIFGFQDGQGQPVSLADFKAKIVVLNFWATWCPPCVAEMPSLDRLQKDMASDSFTVLPISVDSNGAASVARFYQRHRLVHLPRYIDGTGRSMVSLKVRGLPTTVILNGDGAEVARLVGELEWDSRTSQKFLAEIAKAYPPIPLTETVKTTPIKLP